MILVAGAHRKAEEPNLEMGKSVPKEKLRITLDQRDKGLRRRTLNVLGTLSKLLEMSV